MKISGRWFSLEGILFLDLFLLVLISTLVLRSVASFLFPTYYIYIFIAAFVFYIFLSIDFEVFESFSSILYVISIILLIIPLIIGQVTRGAIRWIPIGDLSIQPSEIVRPFLILFFARFLLLKEASLVNLFKGFILFLIPFILILIQPSLGVAGLTFVGFLGVILASNINKKNLLLLFSVLGITLPLVWLILQPYQKQRIYAFLDPAKDPLGSGYNSIQAMISVGSGGILGRGLGKGVQTQLSFLPEKHTDFIFATIAEELGLLGSLILLILLFVIFWVLIKLVEESKNKVARAYATGVFLLLFVESFVHIAMNMGLVPITGVPLPFVSAGGSALIGTTISLSIALKGKK